VTNWNDSFKIGGYDVQHLQQAILGLQDCLAAHSADISKELQKERFHVFTGAIPEAGFLAPESGFQGITLNRSCDANLWKVNKNKENRVGGIRFRMVTNLHSNGTWTHSE